MTKTEVESVFFDYFTFTVRLYDDPEKIFDLLGVNRTIFEYKKGGSHHYEHTYIFNHIFYIRYAEMEFIAKQKYNTDISRPSFEINVLMTGRAVREYGVISDRYKSCFAMLLELRENKELIAPINFTRVDLTRDDKDGLIDLPKLEKKIARNQVVTRLSHSQVKSMLDREKGVHYGHTIYFGSSNANSEFFIRIYNKSAERFAKKEVGKTILEEHNVRVEMVFKQAKQANKIMDLLFKQHDEGKPLGEIYSRVLLSKLSFLKNGKKPSKRQEENLKNMDLDFKKFIDTTSKLHLGVERNAATIDKKIDYLKSHEKVISMVFNAIGEEEFKELMKGIVRSGTSKLNILEQNEIMEYRMQKEEEERKIESTDDGFDDEED